MEIERTAKDIRNAGTAAAANNHVSACLHFNLGSNKKEGCKKYQAKGRV